MSSYQENWLLFQVQVNNHFVSHFVMYTFLGKSKKSWAPLKGKFPFGFPKSPITPLCSVRHRATHSSSFPTLKHPRLSSLNQALWWRPQLRRWMRQHRRKGRWDMRDGMRTGHRRRNPCRRSPPRVPLCHCRRGTTAEGRGTAGHIRPLVRRPRICGLRRRL